MTREVTCVAGPVVQRLAVTPPHIRLRVDPEPGSGGAATALASRGAAAADPRRLVARRPAPRRPAGRRGAPADHGHSHGGPQDLVQVLDPLRDGRYPLRRILDTVTVHGDVELAITVGDGTIVTFATISGTSPVNDPWTAT